MKRKPLYRIKIIQNPTTGSVKVALKSKAKAPNLEMSHYTSNIPWSYSVHLNNFTSSHSKNNHSKTNKENPHFASRKRQNRDIWWLNLLRHLAVSSLSLLLASEKFHSAPLPGTDSDLEKFCGPSSYNSRHFYNPVKKGPFGKAKCYLRSRPN